MHRRISAVFITILITALILALFSAAAAASGKSDFDPSRPVGSGYDEYTENDGTDDTVFADREIFVSSVMGEGSIIAIAVMCAAAVITAVSVIIIKRKKENRE